MSLATIDRYDPARVSRHGDHAIVVGASIAGLLAARVLADAFEHVTIIERDPLDGGTEPRRGVPQAEHVHVLLSAGQEIMEDLAPGFSDDLVDAGAVVCDLSREFHVHAAGDLISPGTTPIPIYLASRPLVERVLRARIAAHGRITLRSACQVIEPVVTDARETIRGVVVHQEGDTHEVTADLVVDASGRSSRATAWLDRLGYPRPSAEEVHVDLAYRTCQLRRPPDDLRALLVMPAPPRARGAAVLPVEGDRWFVTLVGMHGQHPPDELDELRDFAGSLPVPMVRELLEEREVVTPKVARYRYPTQTRRRFDTLEEHPRGMIVLGDAVANFNPIYGQGMSVSALQALSLHHTLADDGTENLAPNLYRRVGKVVEGAWNLAAGGDFQFPQTEGSKPPGTDVVNRYINRLHRKAHTDGELADAFNEVVVMRQPPTSLFRPKVAWRTLRPGQTRR